MADKQRVYSDFSGGLNNLENPYLIKENELQLALNVDILKNSIRARSGLTLFNHDSTKSGGITEMKPYYHSDGTKKLMFINGENLYSINASIGVSDEWTLIGDIGTEQDNPSIYIYDNKAVIGSGKSSDNLYTYDNTQYLYPEA